MIQSAGNGPAESIKRSLRQYIIESSVYDGASGRITGQHLDDRADYDDPG